MMGSMKVGMKSMEKANEDLRTNKSIVGKHIVEEPLGKE